MKLFMWLIHIFIRWPAEETSIGLTNVSLNGDSFSWKAAFAHLFCPVFDNLTNVLPEYQRYSGYLWVFMFAINYAFQFFFGFFCCGIVVGRFEIVLDHLKVVVGRCGILWLPQAYTSKSCAYHPDSECCTFFHGNLSNLKSPEQGRIQEFLKGGLYTTEVTLNTNGVEGEWRPLPLARSLEWVGSHTPPPKT